MKSDNYFIMFVSLVSQQSVDRKKGLQCPKPRAEGKTDVWIELDLQHNKKIFQRAAALNLCTYVLLKGSVTAGKSLSHCENSHGEAKALG